jgi:membrane-bound lytic murein transglycosylase A
MRMNTSWRIVLVAAGIMIVSTTFLCAAPPLGHGYEFAGNGKRPAPIQKEIWQEDRETPSLVLAPSQTAAQAGAANLAAVNRLAAGKGTISSGNVTVPREQWRQTARLVARLLEGKATFDELKLRSMRCRGEDGQGNVHFTGYFTPQLHASRTPDRRFRFPVYALPSSLPKPWPTRQRIDHEAALAKKGFELAWVDDLLELYFLHVQGSGQLLFQDGTMERVGFAGGNGHGYKSLGRVLVDRGSIPAEAISLRAIRNWFEQHPEELIPMLNLNPSYTFFEFTKKAPRGAANVDLIDGHSVAGDRKIFPPGTCLLAEVPVLNEEGRLAGHEWRVLFVHDTGSAIKGPGHLDLYHGVGREAGEKAGDLHHYGRLWLLLAPPAAPVSRPTLNVKEEE